MKKQKTEKNGSPSQERVAHNIRIAEHEDLTIRPLCAPEPDQGQVNGAGTGEHSTVNVWIEEEEDLTVRKVYTASPKAGSE